MTGRIFVAGDVHLGAENADVDAFDNFLDGVDRRCRPADRLVLLGDIWDLVRRDPFGCAWETSETVTAIKQLVEKLPVYLVFGNHDTYLRNLDSTLYDIDFCHQLVLESGEETVRFCHGERFDRIYSGRLSHYLSGAGDRGDFDLTRGAKDPIVAKGRELIGAGKRHLRSAYEIASGREPTDYVPYPRRERRAHAYLETIPEDKLIYGHTHAPYVRSDNAVANPGSWKSTVPVHNTYLCIEDGEITLYRHEESGSDEMIDVLDTRDSATRTSAETRTPVDGSTRESPST